MLKLNQSELRNPVAKKSSRSKPKTNYVRQNKLRPAIMGNTHSVDSKKVNGTLNDTAQPTTSLRIDIDHRLARALNAGSDIDNHALKARNQAYLVAAQNQQATKSVLDNPYSAMVKQQLVGASTEVRKSMNSI